MAGTATSAAAIDQELEPYDPARVHGYTLMLATVEMLLARLADMDESQRRTVAGLHPDRAPTIVAVMILLSQAMRAFELDEVEVSEHDILHGGALSLAGAARHAPSLQQTLGYSVEIRLPRQFGYVIPFRTRRRGWYARLPC